jgi:serine/threonine protein kinase/Flp pilus assembly protein TadD
MAKNSSSDGVACPNLALMKCMNERSIFESALDIDDPSERDAYVASACGADTTLRREVEKLLSAHHQPGDFMRRPAPESVAGLDARAVAEGPGTVIGSYKLLEQIGEGGFGFVYMAEQSQPVHRRVALKILKPGMDTRQVIARFEAERQALALMDHPHIAHVFDGGETASGRPYFVMELVRGVPITQFCDENGLPLRERLALFVDVCQAIQHAHQKGIIHRDLKPTNVLITLHDDRAVVKVIDFGIAKATGQRLTEKTLFTNFAQMIGTPLYMSPEQAQMSGLDVDTRSDIYSLGVLLYELLTGTTPFDSQRLRTAAFDEVRRIIVEEEPPKPSTRISTPGKGRARVSTNRRNDGQELGRQLRGELDWIVMKCLEKDRNRRYATANGLAADVQRYLNDEPVQAFPPSAWYSLRKLVARNKMAVTMVVALAAVVVVAVAGLAVTNVMIRREQSRTQVERDRAQEAQELAENRADEIRDGMERLKAANAFHDRAQAFAEQLRWGEAHAAFTKAIELRPDHVTVRAERGDFYALLGLWELAAADCAREFELPEPDSTTRWYRHALLRLHNGDVDGYRALCRRMQQRFSGTHIPLFLTEVVRTCVLSPSGDADLARLVELAEQRLASEPRGWYPLYLLGIAQYRAGEHDKAARRLQESLAGHPEWDLRALSYPVLAMALHRSGRAAEARHALDAATAAIDRWMEVRLLVPDWRWMDHHGAGTRWPVAWWDWLEFQIYFREARLLIKGTPPPDDARFRLDRARSLAALQRPEEARVQYAAALELSPHDRQIRLEAHRNQGYCYVQSRQWRLAADEFALASELAADDVHFWVYRVVAQLANGDLSAYRETCAEMVDRFAGTKDPRTARYVVYACMFRADTLSDMAQLVPLAHIADPAWNGDTYMLAAALYRAGRYDDAVRYFETATTASPPRALQACIGAMAHYRLGNAVEARRHLAEAARWIEEANRQQVDDPSGTRPAWADWYEPIVYELLLREAQTLLGDEA